jgi:hypothetical protein
MTLKLPCWFLILSLWLICLSSVSGESASTIAKADFKALGGWKFIEGKSPIPDAVKKLDGKLMEFKGFMMPINEVEKIKRFILIQSLWGCCFGQAPEANHVIVVTMKEGKTTDFFPDAIRVIGRFSVSETREEGFLVSIYQVEADRVLRK